MRPGVPRGRAPGTEGTRPGGTEGTRPGGTEGMRPGVLRDRPVREVQKGTGRSGRRGRKRGREGMGGVQVRQKFVFRHGQNLVSGRAEV